MNTNPAISILVPVYKVEAYLKRCIDSVLAQDFQDWEMILVDDGSPDKCPQLCDEAVRKDERIKVVHKENAGALAARYDGYKIAKGEYLVFLDSDDWLMPNALSTLYHHIQKGEYDIVRGCNKRVREDGSYTIEKGIFHKGIIEGCEMYLKALLEGKLRSYLWGAIYKKELFTEYTFRSILQFSIGEDWLTNIAIWKNVNRMQCIDDVVYAYYMPLASTMQSSVCSFEYIEREHNYADKLTKEYSEEIESIKYDCRMRQYLRQFFVPEIPFSWKHYQMLQSYILKNNKNKEKLKEFTSPRYVFFIGHKIIFYLYCKLYCFLFLYIKQKGRKRRVIK